MPQHIIAMDMSSQTVRVAVIEANFRRAALLQVRTVEIPAGATPAEAWQHVRAEISVPLDAVVVGLDAKMTSTRLLTFPFGDVRKAESAVEFELEGQIPYAIDEVATCQRIVQRTPNEITILAAITPRAPLLVQLQALTAAGIEPRAVVVPAAALAEFMPAGETAVNAIVSLGASQTHVALCGPELTFVRTVRAGGDDIDRALAKHFAVSVPDAKLAKHQEARILAAGETASPEITRLSEVLTDGLAPLAMQLYTTFKSLPAGQAPARLLLTGGLSRLPGLAAHLSRRLSLPVELLDLHAATDFLGAKPAGMGPEYALCLGMAVGLFRHGRDLPLNFRRGELAYHGDIQLYRGQFTRLAVGLAVVFILAIMMSTVRYSMLRDEEKEIDRGFCTATQRIIGREICDPTAALATLKQVPGAEGVTIPSYSAAALLEMLSKSVGTEIDVQFDELDLRVEATGGQPERLSGKGEAASFESTEQLVAALKRDACVQDAEVSKLRKGTGSGRVEFNLTAKVMCPAGLRPGARLTMATTAPAAEPGSPVPQAPPPFDPPPILPPGGP